MSDIPPIKLIKLLKSTACQFFQIIIQNLNNGPESDSQKRPDNKARTPLDRLNNRNHTSLAPHTFTKNQVGSQKEIHVGR